MSVRTVELGDKVYASESVLGAEAGRWGVVIDKNPSPANGGHWLVIECDNGDKFMAHSSKIPLVERRNGNE